MGYIGSWVYLIIAIVIGAALYSPISEIINGKYEFWNIFLVIFGIIAVIYHLGSFIVLLRSERESK